MAVASRRCKICSTNRRGTRWPEAAAGQPGPQLVQTEKLLPGRPLGSIAQHSVDVRQAGGQGLRIRDRQGRRRRLRRFHFANVSPHVDPPGEGMVGARQVLPDQLVLGDGFQENRLRHHLVQLPQRRGRLCRPPGHLRPQRVDQLEGLLRPAARRRVGSQGVELRKQRLGLRPGKGGWGPAAGGWGTLPHARRLRPTGKGAGILHPAA